MNFTIKCHYQSLSIIGIFSHPLNATFPVVWIIFMSVVAEKFFSLMILSISENRVAVITGDPQQREAVSNRSLSDKHACATCGSTQCVWTRTMEGDRKWDCAVCEQQFLWRSKTTSAATTDRHIIMVYLECCSLKVCFSVCALVCMCYHGKPVWTSWRSHLIGNDTDLYLLLF